MYAIHILQHKMKFVGIFVGIIRICIIYNIIFQRVSVNM